MTCAACSELMPPEGEWHALNGLTYHNSGSCLRLYRRRRDAAIQLAVKEVRR